MVSAGAQFATSDTGSKWLNDYFGGISPKSTTTDVSGIMPGEVMG